MKAKKLFKDAEYYIENLDHSLPILHYHVSFYLRLIGGTIEEGDYDVMRGRIDGRKTPEYPGYMIIDQIRNGELDPVEHGLLPYMRGWEWTFWVLPSPWIRRLPMNYELIAIDGIKGCRKTMDIDQLKSIFGMSPLGFVLGKDSVGFRSGMCLHDKIINIFKASSENQTCNEIMSEKLEKGEWYFPDAIVFIEDIFEHVEKHRNLVKNENKETANP